MNTGLQFDYYYGRESEQFSFFRIPRLMFQDERFKTLSCEAKLLYGLMLDRLSLSQKNNWFDEEGRTYIIYKLEHICIDMGCGKDKIVKTLAELDAEKGIGLIERKKQGLGRPMIIYVKNFATITSQHGTEQTGEGPANPHGCADFGKTEVKTSENPNSGLRKNRSLDFCKSDPSYINNTKTEKSNTDLIYPSIHTEPVSPGHPDPEEEKAMDQMDSPPALRKRFIPTIAPGYFGSEHPYRELIREHINYDRHMRDDPDRELYDGFYQLICDVVESRHTGRIYVNREPLPIEVVRSRLLKITEDHMEYVVSRFKENTNEAGIRNVRSYMLTMLYNAQVTMDAYIHQKVNHDMYGGGLAKKEHDGDRRNCG